MRQSFIHRLSGSGMVLLGLCTAMARADVVPGVTVAPSSQHLLAHNIIDGSGVDGDAHSTITQQMWLSAAGTVVADQYLRFDLGQAYNLQSIKMWNYNEATQGNTDRGVNQFRILASPTGVPGTFLPVGAAQTLDEAPGIGATPYAQSFGMGGSFGRFIMVDIDSNHGDPEYVGLSEVQFDGAATGFAQDVMPVSVTASSQLNATRGPEQLFGPGLNVYDEHQTSWADNAMWQSSSADWSDGEAILDFDFGGKTSLSAVRIWSFNEYPPDHTGTGVKTMEILAKAELGDEFTSIGTIHPNAGLPVNNRDFSEIFDLSVDEVQYIRFRITENWGGSASPTVGLSEVQFIGALPEPASLALLALGFPLVARRRRGR